MGGVTYVFGARRGGVRRGHGGVAPAPGVAVRNRRGRVETRESARRKHGRETGRVRRKAKTDASYVSIRDNVHDARACTALRALYEQRTVSVHR